jgi:hypothetical protein
MAQARQTPQERKIAELKIQILELQAKLAESERLCASRELSLLEDGLRLSQENEVLRNELAKLKKSRSAAR